MRDYPQEVEKIGGCKLELLQAIKQCYDQHPDLGIYDGRGRYEGYGEETTYNTEDGIIRIEWSIE